MALGSQVVSGAKLEMTIVKDGSESAPIAFATNASYTVNHNMQPIECFGNPAPEEYAELGITVEFSASKFRIATNAATQLGLMPTLEEFLKQPTLNVTIKDKTTGTVLIRVVQVKAVSRTGSVDARGVFTETINFVGLKALES